MNAWRHIKDGYPISGPNDPKFDGVWYGLECEVMDDRGNVSRATFNAAWVVDLDGTGQMWFDMSFGDDIGTVMYWRAAE